MAGTPETGYGLGMGDDANTPSKRSVIARLRGALKSPEVNADTRDLGLRILARTERVVDRLEGAAETLESVAKLELALLRRMAPIVEDLGELMRHTLNEARERRGLGPRGVREPTVIDVASDAD